jgi:hypothetical protein
LRTMTTLGIIPHHLKLCSKKAMSPIFKRSLLVLGVQTFRQARRNLLQKGRGRRQLSSNSPRNC